MEYTPPPSGQSAGASRDAGLWKLSRLRRGLTVGCVALVGGFSAFVAQAKPGKSTGAATTTPPTGSSSNTSGSGSNFAQTPLRAPSSVSSSSSSAATVSPPAQPPVPAPVPAPAAPVVSGGS